MVVIYKNAKTYKSKQIINFMAGMKIIIPLALIFSVVLISGCIQSQETQQTQFKVFDQALNEVGTFNSDVTIPLDDSEACEVAKDAAQVYGQTSFKDCDEIQRIENIEINVIDSTSIDDYTYAEIAKIDENLKTVTFYSSP
ncbi:MAG: hypothetical protein J7K26_03960 [Candidatus Aenigmarchaeota archaeon]|nr:hypothetical protein [Candidatus Aenigmarchaeota archaeon]